MYMTNWLQIVPEVAYQMQNNAECEDYRDLYIKCCNFFIKKRCHRASRDSVHKSTGAEKQRWEAQSLIYKILLHVMEINNILLPEEIQPLAIRPTVHI